MLASVERRRRVGERRCRRSIMYEYITYSMYRYISSINLKLCNIIVKFMYCPIRVACVCAIDSHMVRWALL